MTQFTILNACAKRWDELPGDGRERLCETCQTPVHAIEQYSQEEWVQVWRENNGHVCGYLAGQTHIEQRSRRAILIGALLTFVSPLMAQDGLVRIRVTDVTGAVIPGAEAHLLSADDKILESQQSDGSGQIVWRNLALGNRRIQIQKPGFISRVFTVIVTTADETVLEAPLQVVPFMMGVMVEEGSIPITPIESPLPSSLPLTSPREISLTGAPKRHRWWLFGH